MDTLITTVFSGLPGLKKSNYRLSIENSNAPATHEKLHLKNCLTWALFLPSREIHALLFFMRRLIFYRLHKQQFKKEVLFYNGSILKVMTMSKHANSETLITVCSINKGTKLLNLLRALVTTEGES